MKDRYGVISTHAVGRHHTIVIVLIFHALFGLHFIVHQVFDNQESSAFAQSLVVILAFFVVEMA